MSDLRPLPTGYPELLQELKEQVRAAKGRAAAAVNATLTLLYWSIGEQIRRRVLGAERAAYGEQILATLSHDLTAEFGRGFELTNLTRMIKFAEVFPDGTKVATLSQHLSWSHFRELLPLAKPLQREFYAEMCRIEGWSVRTLRGRIDSMLYERTALSRKPDELAHFELTTLREKDQLGASLILNDPYVLDFLDVQDHYQERDLEDAILREMELFLLEMGAGFSFVGRQKRIQLDGEDFYIDLLF